MVNERIEKEITLLRSFYKEVEYIENGQWVLIKNHPLPVEKLWNRQSADICFQVLLSYPGAPPYGFYVPAGIKCGNNSPQSYTEPASNTPPFAGKWGFFSWQQDSSWFPTADLKTGSNLLGFARTFKDRFMEGA